MSSRWFLDEAKKILAVNNNSSDKLYFLILSAFIPFCQLRQLTSCVFAIYLFLALAKRRRKLTQVEDLGQLATSFGQGLRALALTCDDLITSTGFQLKITEAFHIQRQQPSLNQQLHHVNLKLSF